MVVNVSSVLDQGDLSVFEDSGRPDPQCAKHMIYGPCGGVRPDGACELGDRPCPFVERALVRWNGPAPEHDVARPAPAPSPIGAPAIVIDLRVAPFELASINEVTGRLAGVSDAILIGEHHARPDFPPTFMARAVADAGGRPWVTLTCRDRNRVVLEAELEALATMDIAGVHCVTGDARASSVRTDASQVFDLDSLRLAALARRVGLTVSVAATPLAPPRSLRPLRLLEKERAGASVCFVNHAAGAAGVAAFVGHAHRVGVTMSFVPCVAVFTDARSFEVLEGFPGLVLDPAERQRVLGSPDTRQAGIDAAVDQALAMLNIDGVIGVNLSGSATAGSERDGATIMVEVAAAIRRRRRLG